MEPTSSGVAGLAALLKSLGLSATLGMVGAALLYIVLPPVNPDGTFNRKEFAARLAAAGVFSVVFGDMGADMLSHFVSFINPEKHKSAIDLLIGAPGWWVSRAVAIWLQKHRDSDIAQLVDTVKKELP